MRNISPVLDKTKDLIFGGGSIKIKIFGTTSFLSSFWPGYEKKRYICPVIPRTGAIFPQMPKACTRKYSKPRKKG